MTKQKTEKPEAKNVLNPFSCVPAKARTRLRKLCEKLRNFSTSPKELELVKEIPLGDGLRQSQVPEKRITPSINLGVSTQIDPKITEQLSVSMAEYLTMTQGPVSEQYKNDVYVKRVVAQKGETEDKDSK